MTDKKMDFKKLAIGINAELATINDENFTPIMLPIDAIDDFNNLRVSLQFHKRSVVLSIDCYNITSEEGYFIDLFRLCISNKLHDDGCTCCNSQDTPLDHRKLPVEVLIYTLNKIYNVLPKLKFNNYKGEFEYENKIKYHDELIKFCTHDNIKLSSDDCCVCHEPTKCKTPCDHFLCYRCRNKLKPTPDADGDDETLCPICRSTI